MVELHSSGPGCYRQAFGGDTLNTAAYIARLGKSSEIQVEYLTGLGTDLFSNSMVDFFHKLGVGTGHIRRLKNRMPGLYIIEVDAHGERFFQYWRSEAAARFCLDRDNAATLADELSCFGHIYLSGISLAILTPKGRGTLFKTLELLKRSGTHICFDSNYRPQLWADTAQAQREFRRILELSDTAILTAEDMRTLFALENNKDILDLCVDHAVSEVVLKRGKNPCLIRKGGQDFEVPSKKNVQVVDTTAAGDSFNAAYLTARILGNDPEFSARCGHELAAAVIQHHGAIIESRHMPDNLLLPNRLQETMSCARS